MVETVAVLSPGEMGGAVGHALYRNGFDVVTCLQGRSNETRQNAALQGFRELPNLEALVQASDLILSILVPARAPEVARAVAEALRRVGKRVAYADCNAVSPHTSQATAPVIEAAGGRFIDGGIVGGPPREDYAPRFYVSGPEVAAIEPLNRRGIEVVPVGDGVGSASAVKMCYAALTKGTSALQATLLTAAQRLGVYDVVTAEFQHSQKAAYQRMETSMGRLPKVAHRWIGEMEEIASTFESVGVPGDFHHGAADIFRLIAASQLSEEAAGVSGTDLQEAIAILASEVGTKERG